jgi:hypothetical protein
MVELAWKTLQDKLYEEGYVDIKGPKPVIKQAFHDGIIKDGQGLDRYLVRPQQFNPYIR